MVEDNYKAGDWIWDKASRGLPLGQATRDGNFNDYLTYADWYGPDVNCFPTPYRHCNTTNRCRVATKDEINKWSLLPTELILNIW